MRKSPPLLRQPAADADACERNGYQDRIGGGDILKDRLTIFTGRFSFPLNLTRMLESVESMGLAHIIHWREDEKSFIFCDEDLFLSEVLPKFFK